MDRDMYIGLHHAADRLALEAAREDPDSQKHKSYIENYTKVLEFLVDKYKELNPEEHISKADIKAVTAEKGMFTEDSDFLGSWGRSCSDLSTSTSRSDLSGI